MKIAAMIDMIQEGTCNLTIPEIRVWYHPPEGDDCFKVFDTFQEAADFIKGNPTAEDVPLVAFKGWELNIFDIDPPKK